MEKTYMTVFPGRVQKKSTEWSGPSSDFILPWFSPASIHLDFWWISTRYKNETQLP